MKSRIIHIDLFSGAGGFHEGLIRAGFKFTNHFYSEIDKHAIANYKFNYPDAKYIGSVTNVRHIIRTVDRKPEDRVVITFGSPCQDFSLAGRRAGLEGSKSSLIKFALVLIRWIRPDVYIWENVKGAYSSNGGADYWAIIQAFANIDGYRFEQQLLNTSWVLPQNRERIYIVGHLRDRSKPGVFPISESLKWYDKRVTKHDSTIIRTLTAGGNSGGQHSGMTLIRALMSGNNGGQHQNMTLIKTNTSKGFEIANEGDSINFSNPNSKTRRGRVGKGVAQTLDTQANQGVIQKTGVKTYDRLIENHNFIEGEIKALDFYNNSVHNECPTLKDPSHNDRGLFDGTNIRRLTEIECERLQGFKDNHTKFGFYEKQVWINKKEKTFKIVEKTHPIPKTQRYKLMGNAVTCDIVQLIAERIELL